MEDPRKRYSPGDIARAYQAVFDSPDGHIVLAHLQNGYGFTRDTLFVPGDAHHTAFKEGQRSVLVSIGRMLEADPDQLDESQETEL